MESVIHKAVDALKLAWGSLTVPCTAHNVMRLIFAASQGC